jgi:hypothetical protein
MHQGVYAESTYLLVASLGLFILSLLHLLLHKLGELFLHDCCKDVAEPRLTDLRQILFRRQVPLHLLFLGDPGEEIDQSQAIDVRAVSHSDSFALHVVFPACKNVSKESSATTQ